MENNAWPQIFDVFYKAVDINQITYAIRSEKLEFNTIDQYGISPFGKMLERDDFDVLIPLLQNIANSTIKQELVNVSNNNNVFKNFCNRIDDSKIDRDPVYTNYIKTIMSILTSMGVTCKSIADDEWPFQYDVVYNCKFNVFQFLLRLGVDFSIEDQYGATAFYKLLKHEDTNKIAAFFNQLVNLDKGLQAKIISILSSEDKNQMTAFDLFCIDIDNSKIATDTVYANNVQSIIKIMVDVFESNTNHFSKDNWTILHHLAYTKNECNTMSFLLENTDINPRLKNLYNRTAMDIAYENHHPDVGSMLFTYMTKNTMDLTGNNNRTSGEDTSYI